MTIWYGQDRITGSTSDQPVDQILYERYFVGKTNGFFIEAGAGDGVFLSTCKAFEESFNWHGLNIEPSKELFFQLCRNRPNPNSINVNLALSDESGKTVKFEYVSNSPGFSRIRTSALSWIDKTFKLEIGSIYDVQTITYADLIKLYNIKSINLMVLDAENHEIEIISGMAGSTMPEVFCVEWTQCGLESLKRMLPDYRLDWNDGLNAIFIKKDFGDERCHVPHGRVD